MDKHSFISTLQKELLHAHCDVKAEPQLLLAISKGLSEDDFVALCDRFFKREFSKDVYSSNIKDDKKQGMLEIHLSRTGLYDQLPEGLFFQMPKRASRQTIDDAALDYRYNRKKEEEIRKFFSPFDNGFFRQRIQLEEEESALLEGLRSGVLNDYFISFWGLPASIPKMFIVPLVLLLPHANKIAGDLAMTAESLKYILKEDVKLVQKEATVAQSDMISVPLGEAGLGMNMVCGELFFEDNPVIEIQIGPIKNSNVRDYLAGGKRDELMETFKRFFLPAGLDVITTVLIASEKQDMLLEKGSEPVLGYSTVLG